MNKVKNAILGKPFDRDITPSILSKDDLRYHLKATCLKWPVVFFTTGPQYRDGYSAGTHDGIRDGNQSGRYNWSDGWTAYCSHDDWVDSGNPSLI